MERDIVGGTDDSYKYVVNRIYREDKAAVRIQFLFDDKPDEETRTILKSNGFRWSPKNKAWQRMLNDNGRRAAERVLNELR